MSRLTQNPRALIDGAENLTSDAGNLTAGHENLTPTGIPAFLAEDTATREWLKVYDPASASHGWHPADVEWALKQAHTLLRRLGGRVGPSGGAGFWPAILQDEGEAYTPRRISSAEVSSVHASIGWAWSYLGAPERENERRAIQAWCYCTEHKQSHSQFIRRKGLTRTTEQLRRRRGLAFIAAGLCAASVSIPRDVLLARLERARSDVRGDADDALALAARAAPTSEPAIADAASQPAGRVMPVIDALWSACALAGHLAPGARGPEVLALIADRVRIEADAGALSLGNGGVALSARSAALQAEAVERGLLDPGERRAGALTREELTARIERNRGNA